MVQIYRSMRLLFVEWLHLRRLPVPLIGVVLSMVGSRRLGSRFSVVVSVDDRVGGLVSSGRCFSGGVGVAIALIISLSPGIFSTPNVYFAVDMSTM